MNENIKDEQKELQYFEVKVLLRGKKEIKPIYASSIHEARKIAKLKFNGIILKVSKSTPPLKERFEHFKNTTLTNLKRSKVKPDSQIAAIRQLSVMTNAGISIHDSITEVANSTIDNNLKNILKHAADDINSGSSLSQSFRPFKLELGNLTIAMIELGEQTGKMSESLNSLADMLEGIRVNITKFKKAMAYPRNVMIAMTAAFIVLIMYVVPKFKDIFEKLGADLPLPTKILLWLEHALNTYGALIASLIFTIFIVLNYLITHDDKVRYIFHKILLKIYLIKKIILFATLNRFTLVFTELITAGIPVADALNTSIAMVDNLVLRKRLNGVKFAVDKGAPLYDGLKETKLFENMIIQMVSAGESSGQLDTMFKNISEYFKMKFDAIIDNLSQAIEPILLAMIAAMVTMLALGIFLPMWDMSSAVKG